MTSLNHKILAGNFEAQKLFSNIEISRDPVLYDSLSFAKSPNFRSLRAKIDIAGIEIGFSYNIPDVQVSLNPYTEKVESEIWGHCQKFGLYEGKEKAVRVSKFAWLPGLVDPELSYDALKAVSNGFLDLFAHDDDIDNQDGKPDFLGLSPVNQRFIDIASGNSPVVTDAGKVKGYSEAMTTFFSKHLKEGNREFFIYTLSSYLKSTEIEAIHITNAHEKPVKLLLSYSDYSENRRDTSGIYHAVAMMWVAHNLDVKHLMDRYYPLKTMFKFVPDIVCRINDIASCKKELNGFARYANLSSVTTEEEAERVKPFITANAVLLKFCSGKSLDDAVLDTLSEYHDQLNGFVNNLSILQDHLQTDPELKKTVDILFGWVVGHGVWSGISKRYNLVLN